MATSDTREADKFLKRYEKRFGIYPATEAANSYDIVHLLLEGVKGGALNSFLHNVKDFKGVIGTYSSDGNNGFTLPVALKLITKDEFKFFE